MCIEHMNLLKDYYNDKVSLNLSKKHFGWYLKGFPNASTLRKSIMSCNTISEISDKIHLFGKAL